MPDDTLDDEWNEALGASVEDQVTRLKRAGAPVQGVIDILWSIKNRIWELKRG